MIHIGDVYERTESGILYHVTTIREDYALGRGVHNSDDEVLIPLIGQTMFVSDSSAWTLVECPHEQAPSKSVHQVSTLYASVAFNNGILDSKLRDIAWVLRDLAINAGAYPEEKLIRIADDAVRGIHLSYQTLRPMGRGGSSSATLGLRRLPPVN